MAEQSYTVLHEISLGYPWIRASLGHPWITYVKLEYSILCQDNFIYPKNKVVLQGNQGYP